VNINLCFHGIGTCAQEREPGEAHYWITRDLFRRVLDEAAARPDDVILSFDDGNRSDIEIGLPELESRGLRATFFVLAGRLDDAASLTPDDLVRLRDAGMTIGSHGWSHVPWRGLNDADSRREFIEARSVIAETAGVAVDEAAFPLGRYDRQTLRRLRQVGYRHVYSSDRFPARRGSWLQARYSLTADDTMDSVRAVLTHRPGLADARNVLASGVKRLR
jgi:peptidoglycan/xylan/chitin deacetylase (PgdA/CDA1 family)